MAGTLIRLVTDKPLMLFVVAERTERAVPFAQPPMQSDYKVRGDEAEQSNPAAPTPADAASEPRVQPFCYQTRWQSLKRRLKQHRKYSLRNRRFFTRIDPL